MGHHDTPLPHGEPLWADPHVEGRRQDAVEAKVVVSFDPDDSRQGEQRVHEPTPTPGHRAGTPEPELAEVAPDDEGRVRIRRHDVVEESDEGILVGVSGPAEVDVGHHEEAPGRGQPWVRNQTHRAT
jgi:hypothetical protein